MSLLPRITWQKQEVITLFEKPFFDLLFEAHAAHRRYYNPHQLKLSVLLNIKTGACPENCSYCPQSGHYNTGLKKQKLQPNEEILVAAAIAKAQGATRFCIGAAWRNLPDSALPQMVALIKEIKQLGLETCVTLGMLTDAQAQSLKAAGLDYYNHNIDTSEEFYSKITTTRTFSDRLETLQHVRDAGIKVCCGGILGMGESREDRASFLTTLANLSEPPESLPINHLIKIEGTPLANNADAVIEPIEFVRTIAVAKIMMPKTMIRLSAGRSSMSAEFQTLCFFAGANSLFIGDKLLTAPNPELDTDQQLFKQLDLEAMVEDN